MAQPSRPSSATERPVRRTGSLASACGMAVLVAVAAGLQFAPDPDRLRPAGTLDPAIVWLEASGYPYALAACRTPRDEDRPVVHRQAPKRRMEAPAMQDRWCLLPPLQ